MVACGKEGPAIPFPRSPAVVARPAAQEHVDGSPSKIVGVGASAGGLEAFTELLSHLPDDTGMAFVLIQHLDPSTTAISQNCFPKQAKCASLK
jgi:chemotaxis response regulator CheB